MRARNLGISALLLGAPALHTGPAAAYDVEVIQETGSSANRLDLVVLGDGYRTEDQAQLTEDTKQLLEGFWGQEFFSAYRDYLNIRLVHVISTDRGADNGSYGAMVDTALGTNFGCADVDRLLCVDESLALDVASADTPDYDQLLVIVNDPKYGGSGGSIATSSIASGAGDVVVHEIGHSLFGLADEYDTATPGFERCMGDCPEPNATTITDRATIKWGHWIDASTELPTPDQGQDNSVVGAFEGCRYFTDGQFRPVSNCIMRTLGREYCPVCAEVAVLAFYDKVSPIDTLTPMGPVQMKLGDMVTFGVTGPKPTPNTLTFTWTDENDAPLGMDTEGMLTLAGATLGLGEHTVKVAIADTTELVKKDTGGVLKDQAEWAVTVTDGGSGGAGGAGTGGGGGAAGTGGSAGSGGSGGGAGGGGVSGGSGGSGAGGGIGGAGGSGTGGAGAQGGTGGTGATSGVGGTSAAPPPEQESGCGCRVGESRDAPWAAAVGMMALAVALRRRRVWVAPSETATLQT